MVRDWNTIKEVLEDVENRPPDDHLGLWFTNVVRNKNLAMLSASSLVPDPITEEDEHATEKWFHARMLLHAGNVHHAAVPKHVADERRFLRSEPFAGRRGAARPA